MSSFCLLEFEQNRTQLIKICAFVLLLHVFAFVFFSSNHLEKPTPKRSTKLAVRTVVLEPQPKQLIAVQTEPMVEATLERPVEPILEPIAEVIPEPEPEPVTKVEPEPTPVEKVVEPQTFAKKELQNAPVVKKITPKVSKPVIKKPPIVKPKPHTAPVVKKPAAPVKKSPPKQDTAKIERERLRKKREAEAEAKQNALVADAMASLNNAGKLSQKRSVGSKSSSTTAKQIHTLASESLVTIESTEEVLTGREKTYYDELVQRLKLHLKLPDFGDVKIRLTLSRSGSVIKVECIQAKSAKNSAHLKNVLPSITFPSFGQNFPNEKEHTFHLHFSNELSY